MNMATGKFRTGDGWAQIDYDATLFIVAGCVLLWLNFRRRSRDVILTKINDDDKSMP
jgi:hypothetical protein